MGSRDQSRRTRSLDAAASVVVACVTGVKLFARFRVVHYEDTDAVGDFGLVDTRVVRLAAVKP